MMRHRVATSTAYLVALSVFGTGCVIGDRSDEMTPHYSQYDKASIKRYKEHFVRTSAYPVPTKNYTGFVNFGVDVCAIIDSVDGNVSDGMELLHAHSGEAESWQITIAVARSATAELCVTYASDFREWEITQSLQHPR